MPESERSERARLLAYTIDELLAFADEQRDFLLGAKLAEIQAFLQDRYLAGE